MEIIKVKVVQTDSIDDLYSYWNIDVNIGNLKQLWIKNIKRPMDESEMSLKSLVIEFIDDYLQISQQIQDAVSVLGVKRDYIPAVIYRDIFGGEVLKCKIGSSMHWFNKIGDKIIDFTMQNFDELLYLTYQSRKEQFYDFNVNKNVYINAGKAYEEYIKFKKQLLIDETLINEQDLLKLDTDYCVNTNVGTMPIDDYLYIKACQFGYDSYQDMRNCNAHINWTMI